MCMSLVNKSEVGAGLKKCVSKLVWSVYEFGKQIRVRAGLKKCVSKLVWSVYEFGKQTRSESWFEKSVCKLMCEVCMSLLNKSEVGAGLKKVCE